jgi:hypothetical protein
LKYHKDNKDFRVLGTCRLEISISSPFRKLLEKYEIFGSKYFTISFGHMIGRI